MRLFNNLYAAPIDLKNVTVTIQDGTSGTPLQFEIVFDEGNFTWEQKRNLITRKNRGLVGQANNATVTEGDEEVMAISFQGRFDHVRAATGVSLEAILIGDGAFVTTDTANPCSLYAVNIVLENAPSCGVGETLTFPDFRHSSLAFDVKAGTVSVTGESNATRPTSSND